MVPLRIEFGAEADLDLRLDLLFALFVLFEQGLADDLPGIDPGLFVGFVQHLPDDLAFGILLQLLSVHLFDDVGRHLAFAKTVDFHLFAGLFGQFFHLGVDRLFGKLSFDQEIGFVDLFDCDFHGIGPL